MTRAARVAAQAKINMWLTVDEPDGQGYHIISTLFQRIDLADEIVVRTDDTKSRAIVCAGPRMPPGGLGPDRKNLAYRAAEEYHAHAGWPRGFSIEVTKNIPVGGGLGGGSADAGAVLRALNALAPKPLDGDGLQNIAASLGSDVPFFAAEHVRAVGLGRGETLFPFPHPLPEGAVLLLVPPFAISTGEAYRWIDEARPRSPTGPRGATGGNIQRVRLEPSTSAFFPDWGNDFEPVVEARHPELKKLREQLTSLGASVARLSGSGSTVFGIFDGPLPPVAELQLDALVIPTRTSSRVVQVEVLE